MTDLPKLHAAYLAAAKKVAKLRQQLDNDEYDDLFAHERKFSRAHAAMQKAKVAYLDAGGRFPEPK